MPLTLSDAVYEFTVFPADANSEYTLLGPRSNGNFNDCVRRNLFEVMIWDEGGHGRKFVVFDKGTSWKLVPLFRDFRGGDDIFLEVRVQVAVVLNALAMPHCGGYNIDLAYALSGEPWGSHFVQYPRTSVSHFLRQLQKEMGVTKVQLLIDGQPLQVTPRLTVKRAFGFAEGHEASDFKTWLIFSDLI